MRLTTENQENSRVLLHIELEADEMERALDDSYKRLARRVQVPGFRRGKVPRDILERFLGKETLLKEAEELAVTQFYNRAIEEQHIEAIAQPKIEVLHNEPLAFRATVPVRPDVDPGDYKHVRLKQEEVTVGEAEVEKALEQLRLQQAPWEPAERPVAPGDLVTIDVQGTLDQKSVLDEKGLQYPVFQGSPMPVPGFAEKLQGLEKGTETAFAITMPQDYKNPQLAGQTIEFKVKVEEIKQKRLPELDDEFARSLGGGFDNLPQLKERLLSNLKARAEAEAMTRYEEQVVQTVTSLAKLDVPEVLVDREIDAMLNEQVSRFRGGQKSLEAYLAAIGKTDEEIRQEARPHARHRVVRALVLDKIAQVEDIKVSPEEVQAEIDGLAQQAGERADQLRRAFQSHQSRHSVEHAILTRKTVRRLAEIASAVADQTPAAESPPA
ncbi:MAG: trigger factor [Chloroflexi bacterium]|nr:trigger factor [Chloroflexota bacterium]